MVKRDVVWTETAAQQRREILRFWAIKNKSTKYPERLIKLIKLRLKVILNNPLAFTASVIPESTLNITSTFSTYAVRSKLTSHHDIRVSSIGQFSIYYLITDSQLIVVAFWDNRQDPNKVLELLKKKI